MNELTRPLTGAEVNNAVQRVLPHLTPAVATSLRALLPQMQDDGSASVAVVHQTLFPLASTNSASAMLGKVLNALLAAAKANGLQLDFQYEGEKKGGTASRRLIFLGPPVGFQADLESLRRIDDGTMIEGQRGRRLTPEATVLLVTCNEHEYTQLKAALTDAFGAATTLTVTDCTADHFPAKHGVASKLIFTHQGGQAAQEAIGRASRALNPDFVIACGVAFGINADKQHIGDVLVSEQIIPYELSKAAGASFVLRSERPPASARLRGWLRDINVRQTNAAWPKLHAGAVLTGDKLVDDKNYRDELVALAANDMIVGGEMEAAGLHHALARDHIDWIVIKAICDWGDGNKSNPHTNRDQKLAATNAATVAVALLTSQLIASPPRRREGYQLPVNEPTHTPDLLDDLAVAGAVPLDVLRDRPQFVENHKGRRAQLTAWRAATTSGDGEHADGVVALDDMYRWATATNSRPFYALLGESGIGKTTHAQRLVSRLLIERNEGRALPVALYFDLRKVNPGTLIANTTRSPNTVLQSISERVMTDCIANGWVQVNGRLPSVREVQNAIDSGAIVVFDGLDEILARIDDGNGLTLTSGLLRTLEESRSRRGSPQPADTTSDRKSPKLLISCRTQFFRTLAEQEERLTGERRDAAKGQLFEAIELLPLTDTQIRDYLQRAMPTADIEHVMALIDSVHNLRELAERPFTLTLVEEFLPDVEQWTAHDEKITGARLYGTVVERWLLRDKQKQVLAVEDKRQLMMLLARKLAVDGARGISAHSLEQWFDQWLFALGPASRYQVQPRELLYSDVRNSTVLKRSDDANDASNSRFEFAHTSLFEYFLACSLLDGLRHDNREAWAIERVSNETQTFFGELLAVNPQLVLLLQTLDKWRLTAHPVASRVQLDYALRAFRTGLPQPLTEGFNLSGVDLSEWTIGSEVEPLGVAADDATSFSLQGANFSGATLLRTRFWACDLRDTLWRASDSAQAEALACQVNHQLDRCESLPAAMIQRWTVPHEPALASLRIPGRATRWLQRGHSGSVNACAFSSDGQRIVSAGGDGSVRMWAADTGRELRVLNVLSGWVWACALSADGHRIVSASNDGSVRLWDALSGRELRALTGHTSRVNACAFSADGQLIVSAGDDGTVRLWDVASGRALRVLTGHTDRVNACEFSADGKRIVSAGDDETVRVWETSSGLELQVLDRHFGSINACAFSPDDQPIVSAGNDEPARLLDTSSEFELQLLDRYFGSINACAFSPDGKRIVSAGDDGGVRLWDAATGRELRALIGHSGGVRSCAFSPDNEHIVSAGNDGSVRLWNAASGRELRTLIGHKGWVRSCAFSADGQRVVSAGMDGTLGQWDAATGRKLRVLAGHADTAWACAFSADGQRVVSAASDGSVRLWDVNSGRALEVLTGHKGGVNACEFSADGQLIVSAGDDGTVRLWGVASGRELRVLLGHTSGVNACAFSANGEQIVSASNDNSLRLWDTASGRELRALIGHSGGVTGCAFSTSGRSIASAGEDGSVRLWDAVSGRSLQVLRRDTGWVKSCAFSPDGQRIVAGDHHGNLRVWVWDAGSGHVSRALIGHRDSVNSCAVSADGERVVSASRDGTVRLWDAASGRELRLLTGHTGSVSACGFSADGQHIVTAGNDGTVRVWNAESGRELRGMLHAAQATAAWSTETGELVHASGRAWRYIAAQYRDENDALQIMELPEAWERKSA